MTNQKSIKFMAAILLGICCAKASEELQPRQTIPAVDSSMTQSSSKNNAHLELCKNLPQELLPPIILPLPFFDRLKVREVSKIWQNNVDSIHKCGPCLEELVYAISQHKSVALVLKHIQILECYPPRMHEYYEHKLPDSLEEFRKWCSAAYSLRLLSFGIENNYFPFVNFVLEQHPSAFMDPDYFKTHLGNTPLHTVIKYGSPEIIKKFLGQAELMEICLAPENIKGAEGKNPIQFAEMREDSQIIKQILLENKELTDSCC